MRSKVLLSAQFIVIIILFTLSSCVKLPKDNTAERVVLLYLSANNNLSSYAQKNISDLKMGYVPAENSKNILLLLIHLPDDEPKLVRLVRDKKGVAQEIEIERYLGENSSKGSLLNMILNRVKTKYPSKRYGLILWSHATGWLPAGYYNSQYHSTYYKDPYSDLVKSFGDDRGVEMELDELERAIPYKLDFLIFDCCLMGGIEVIYQLRNKSSYILASPTEILANGFPYKMVMEPLFKPKAALEELATLYYEYYSFQSEKMNSATIALYNMEQISLLLDACTEIFENHREKLNSVSTLGVQPYFRLNKRWFWDLKDFIGLLASSAEFSKFQRALESVVVTKYSTPDFLDVPIISYSGISTYIPFQLGNSALDEYYKKLDWNIDSKMIR